MSWEDMMRRILQPIGGVPPHVRSGYGETTNRAPGSSNPPSAFADALGPFDRNPASPAYIPEYRQYLRDARAVPATSPEDVRILTRMPARGPHGSAFDSEPVKVPNIGPASTLPPAVQKQFGGLFGIWPPFSEAATSPDLSQTRQGQPDTPATEDWSAMWRGRTGLP